MLVIETSGNFENTERFLKKMQKQEVFSSLEKYGKLGVDALSRATPKDSGKTASSWSFRVKKSFGSYTIEWLNTHVNQGVNVAIILQLGHGTGTGGYVVGRDYINPAIRPVFDRIANEVWKEVTK